MAAPPETSSSAASDLGFHPPLDDSHENRASLSEDPHAADTATFNSEEEDADNMEDVGISGQDEADDGEVFPVMQLNLPTPTHTKVKKSVYLRSCVKHEDCPPPKFPEFAVIGR